MITREKLRESFSFISLTRSKQWRVVWARNTTSVSWLLVTLERRQGWAAQADGVQVMKHSRSRPSVPAPAMAVDGLWRRIRVIWYGSMQLLLALWEGERGRRERVLHAPIGSVRGRARRVLALMNSDKNSAFIGFCRWEPELPKPY